jgi:hypothetical protein
MITGRELITDVSRYLTDQEEGFEFEHWTEADLFLYFRLALSIVANTAKEKFTKRIEVPLKTGTMQTLPDKCEEFDTVNGTLNTLTGDITFARRVKTSNIRALNRPLCKSTTNSDDGYTVDSWDYDEDDSNTIYVYPPVPAGTDAKMVVTCYSPPDPTSLDEQVNISSSYLSAIFELMLYYGFGVDIESVPSRDRSETHWNKAAELLGLDAKAPANKYAYTRIPEARVKR